MLRYDYIINRDESDEVVEYLPKEIPKELSDAVYIEGPNSIGKSTLLNLIALGFYGDQLNKGEINPSLQERINQLKAAKHQKVTFNITVENEALSSTLISEKKDPEIDEVEVFLEDNGIKKNITPTQFFRDYKLIYDIPSDPLNRLKELLREVKIEQHNLSDKISRIYKVVRNIITEIQEGPTAEKIKKVKEDIKSHKKTQKDLEKKIGDKSSKHAELKEFYLLKFYLDYQQKLDIAEGELQTIDKELKKDQRQEKKKTEDIAKIIDIIRERKKEAEQAYDDVTDLLKNLLGKPENDRIKIWEHSSCKEEIENPNASSLRTEAKYFLNQLKYLKDKEEESNQGEVRLIDSLLEVMQMYSGKKITVPGTDFDIGKFTKILEGKKQEHSTDIIKFQNIEQSIDLLEVMIEKLDSAIDLTKDEKVLKLEKKKLTDLINEHSSSNIKEELIEKRDFLKSKFNSFYKDLVKEELDPDYANETISKLTSKKSIKVYDSFLENQLLDELNKLHSGIAELNNKKEDNEKALLFFERDLKRLEEQKPHEYQEKFKELELIQDILQELGQMFAVHFNKRIEKITDLDIDPEKLTEQDKDYADKIAVFLASKIGAFRHINKTYQVKKIDVVDKKIITKGNKRIFFQDLGTGQGQGAYLEGLLNISDNKKIIALFDEVAMMDQKTLDPIFKKLKELYNQKKLLLAVIVQRGDEVKTRSIIG